jgi:hypothetical protein
MVNDGLGRPGADDEDRSFYLRGDKVWRRLAFKAPLVGRIYDLISLVRMQKASFLQTSLACHALIG